MTRETFIHDEKTVDAIVHDYFGIDLTLVWQILQQDLPAFKAQFKLSLRYLVPFSAGRDLK